MKSYAHKILNSKPNPTPDTHINISGCHGNTEERAHSNSLFYLACPRLMYADEVHGPNKDERRAVRRNDVTDPC